jgi:putative hemolysin
MEWLSSATRPFVWLLSFCTEDGAAPVRRARRAARSVTEEEIAASLEEGVDAGVIEEQEHQMVRNVFRLDERQIGSMMIRATRSRGSRPAPARRGAGQSSRRERTRAIPVCRGGLDDVLGVLPAQGLLQPLAAGQAPALTERCRRRCSCPRPVGHGTAGALPRVGRAAGVRGRRVRRVQGVITVRDVLEAITGEFATPSAEDAWAVQARRRQLADRRPDPGARAEGPPGAEGAARGRPRPLQHAGRHDHAAARAPAEHTDHVDWEGWRFEVVDLDGKRVDKCS